MPMFKARTALGALEDLLDKERSDILAGRFGGLQQVVAEKVRLIQRVRQTDQGNEFMRVKEKATRNQAMLMAAAQGVRAVSDRLAKGVSVQTTFKTYDKSGHHVKVVFGSQNLERGS
ncbi:MAG: flagellar biosynthesis protein FlgN [Paracoccaceae bacterium]